MNFVEEIETFNLVTKFIKLQFFIDMKTAVKV